MAQADIKEKWVRTEWVLGLVVLLLVSAACATSEGAGFSTDRYTAEERVQIDTCRNTEETAARSYADEDAKLVGGMLSLHKHVYYPVDLRGTDGQVIVEFTVTKDGNVVDPEVLRASHSGFSDVAVNAICLGEFQPARHNGEAVSMRMALPVRFNTEPTIIIDETN